MHHLPLGRRTDLRHGSSKCLSRPNSGLACGAVRGHAAGERTLVEQKYIRIFGARQHNLRDIDIEIPRDQLVVLTGLSGSGKSSLAFDTIYAEGQRKYVESLSVHARHFLELVGKPDVERVEGLPPTIAIEQRAGATNPQVTAGIARHHRNLGRNVRVFQTGPDYLDPLVLEHASGHPVTQLDLWMVGKDECRQMLYQAALEADTPLLAAAERA